MLFRMYDMVKTSHAQLNALKITSMHLKLGELEVLSTKIFFKVFEKSKSRPIEKMCM